MDREAMGPRPQERIVGQDPQQPQGFYPVADGVRFLPGDQLTVTCEFDSTSRTKPTYAGSTSKVHLHDGPTGCVWLLSLCWLRSLARVMTRCALSCSAWPPTGSMYPPSEDPIAVKHL